MNIEFRPKLILGLRMVIESMWMLATTLLVQSEYMIDIMTLDIADWVSWIDGGNRWAKIYGYKQGISIFILFGKILIVVLENNIKKC